MTIDATSVSFALVCIYFGLIPTISIIFMPPQASKTFIVVATEIVKIVVVGFMLSKEPKVLQKLMEKWNLVESLKVSAVPAILFAIQNVLIQYGFSLLDPVTFNLLCQSKVGILRFLLFPSFILLFCCD